MLKVNYGNTRARCEIYPKLIIKIPARRHWRYSGAFIANFEHISYLCLVFLLLTLLGTNFFLKIDFNHAKPNCLGE